jgi:hypothetical protein
MKPIGQTFYIDERNISTPGVFIKHVDIYFKQVSPSIGVTLEIRTTLNGVPTRECLPFGRKKLEYPDGTTLSDIVISNDIPNTYATFYATIGDVCVPYGDDTGKVATRFIFDTPVFVETGKSYALVIFTPDTSDYLVWTAEIGQTDVLSGSTITENNATGDLFLSSNDISWIPVITEDMKFSIFIANFTETSGSAVFTTPNEDYLELGGISGTFIEKEPIFIANTQDNIAVMNITGLNGTFSSGDIVFQTDDGTISGSNVAVGTVYNYSSGVVKVKNITAGFGNLNTKLYNATSSGNATITNVSQNASITAASNTFALPDPTRYNVGDYIYISTSNMSNTFIYKVSAVNTSTLSLINVYPSSVNNSPFTDVNCIYGHVYMNGKLNGGLGALQTYDDATRVIIDNVNSGASNGYFSDAVGLKIIGMYSSASAGINNVINVPYNQISPQIAHIAPPLTGINWAFKGVKNDGHLTYDSDYMNVTEGQSNEFIDIERILMSKSLELKQNGGETSVYIRGTMTTANTKVSPSIDILTKLSHFTRNNSFPIYEYSGYYLNITNSKGTFANGDVVHQNDAVAGIVRFANSSFIRVTNVPKGTMFQANSTLLTNRTQVANATITTAEYYSESLDNGYFAAARYISKNVRLADTQNSEDILVYLGAYRPVGTAVGVYAKIQNNGDSDLYDNKHWSLLTEKSNPALSSSLDINDLIEISFGFPRSVNLCQNSSSFGTSSNVVDMSSTPSSTVDLYVGNYVYLYDVNVNKYNIRQITQVIDNHTFYVDSPPSFDSSNSAVGIVPINTKNSAFLNDQNSNIVRYVTSDDLVYDSYSVFSIKIVLASDTTAIVPRVGDMRVLALQA